MSSLTIDERIEGLRKTLGCLLTKPMARLADLDENSVSEAMGVYLIGDASDETILYVGKAIKTGAKHSGQPAGLRFRIMRNHLGRVGDDNFLKAVMKYKSIDKRAAVEYIKSTCYCQWLEQPGEEEVARLEHFAIAVCCPRFNVG